jgi:hypothetical protein
MSCPCWFWSNAANAEANRKMIARAEETIQRILVSHNRISDRLRELRSSYLTLADPESPVIGTSRLMAQTAIKRKIGSLLAEKVQLDKQLEVVEQTKRIMTSTEHTLALRDDLLSFNNHLRRQNVDVGRISEAAYAVQEFRDDIDEAGNVMRDILITADDEMGEVDAFLDADEFINSPIMNLPPIQAPVQIDIAREPVITNTTTTKRPIMI